MNNLLISQRILLNKHGVKVDSLEKQYTEYYNKLGFNLIPASNFLNDFHSFIKNIEFDGVILSGGGNIDYNYLSNQSEVDEKSYSFFKEREIVENYLIEIALNMKMPILGICRGMQKLNTFFGGGLFYNYDYQGKRTPGEDHYIIVNNQNNFNLFDGEYKVNHYHDDAIDKENLSEELSAFAFDKDFETIEGVYNRERNILGIQWHPERFAESHDFSDELLNMFLEGSLYDE